MIAKCYMGLRTRNGELKLTKPEKVFGNYPWEIEISEQDMTFEEMLNDPELFVPHHLLEIKYTSKELKEMGRYNIVPPEELIWIRTSTHLSSLTIHCGIKDKESWKNNISKSMKNKTLSEEHRIKLSEALKNKPLSQERKRKISKALKGKTYGEFSKKFKEHYGITKKDNTKLYNTENSYWRRHNHRCSWE